MNFFSYFLFLPDIEKQGRESVKKVASHGEATALVNKLSPPKEGRIDDSTA